MQMEEKPIAAYLNEDEKILLHDIYFCLSVSVSVLSNAFVCMLNWFCCTSYASPAHRETSRWPCLERAVGQQGTAVFPQDLVKLLYKTFNRGESRWQELFFLPLAFLGLGQPLNLQGHQLLERLKELKKEGPQNVNTVLGPAGEHVAEHTPRSQIWNTRISISLGGTLDLEERSQTELPALAPHHTPHPPPLPHPSPAAKKRNHKKTHNKPTQNEDYPCQGQEKNQEKHRGWDIP